MFTLNEFYKNAWLWKCGKKENKYVKPENINIEELYKTQWNCFFEQAMRNRLVMGALRYGDIRKQKSWDYIDYLKKKLKNYEKTGNTEMLVDIANLALLEFVNGSHKNKHWEAVEQKEHNVKKKG
jgi:hypothetical protein